MTQPLGLGSTLLCSFCGKRMKDGECYNCRSLRFHHDLYRPHCPKCDVPLDDVYKGSLTQVESEWWVCSRCKLELPKYAKAPETDSKVAITFTTSKSEVNTSTPIDETKHFDRLSPFEK